MPIAGIGIDIAHIPRFHRLYDLYGYRFVCRILQQNEIVELKHRQGASMKHTMETASFLAGRWAAKEALVKATREKINMTEIAVLPKAKWKNCTAPAPALEDQQVPIIHAETGSKAKKVLDRYSTTFVTISHDGEYAVAFVVLEKDQAAQAEKSG